MKFLVETRQKRQYLMSWVGGSTWATLFPIYRAWAVYETGLFFFPAHTQNGKLADREDILWIWQKVFWIGIIDYTFLREHKND